MLRIVVWLALAGATLVGAPEAAWAQAKPTGTSLPGGRYT